MALNFIKYVTHSGYGSEDVTISLESTEENRAIIVLVSTYNGSVGAFDVHHTTGTEIATRVFTVNTDFTDAGVYVFSAAQHPGIGDLTIACNTGGQTASYIIIEVEGVSQDITAWAREYTTSDTYDYTTVSSNKIGYAALQFFAAAYSSYAYYSSTFSENFDSPHMEMDANYACIIAKINSEIFEWPEEHNVTTILDSGSGGGPIVGIVYIPPAEFPVTLEVSNDSFIQVPRTRELSHPGRKPVGPVEIDWSHPLSKGLMCVVIPNLQSLDQKNLVTGENFKVSAGQTLLSVGPNEEGAVMKKSSKASGNYWKLDNLLVTPTVTEGFTESFKFKPTSTDNYSYDLMGKFGAYPNYDIDASTDGLQGYIGTSLAGVWGFDHTHKPIVNEWITSTMFTRNKKRVWRVEGVDVVDPTTSSTPQNMPRQMDTFFEAYDRNRSTPGELSYYFLWSRSLNDVELKSLDENPYQFLKPKAPSIPLIFPRNKLEKDAVPIVKAKMLQPELFHPGRKPVGEVEIDWDNPLSTGLTGYFMWSAGVDGKNLAGDSKPVIDGSYNYDSVHIDSAESIQFGNMAANYNLGDSWTFTLLFRYIGGGSNYGHLWCVSDRTNDSGRVYGNGSTTNLRVLNNTVNLDFDLHDGNVHSLSLSVYHIDGAGDDSDYHRCFIDGRLMFESTVSQSDSNFESIGRELYLGTRNDFTSPGGYGYLAFAIHDRLLDMDEHRKLTSNIFGILKPKTSPQLLHTINGDQGYLPVVYDKMLQPELNHSGRKPVGDVEIDWDHPLSENCVGFWLFTEGQPINLVKNKGLSNGTSEAVFKANNLHMPSVLNFDQVGLAHEPIDHTIQGTSAVMKVRHDSLADSYSSLFCTSLVQSGADGFAVGVQGGGTILFTYWHYGSGYTGTKKIDFTSGEWAVIAASTDTASSHELFLNGEQATAEADDYWQFGVGIAAPNAYGNTRGKFTGEVEVYMVFDIEKSPEALKSLSENPYQFLKPKAKAPKFLAPPDQGLFLPDPRFEMPELFHPGRKPVGNVEIDWGHPLAQKIAFCSLMGQHPVDLITGKSGERNGTGGYFENGKWFFEGNIADYFEWPIAPINQQSEKGVALLAIVDDVAGAGQWNIVEAVSSIENDSHARLAQNQYNTAAFFTHGGRLFQGTLPSQYGDVNSLQGKNIYVANFWSDGQVNYDPSYSRTYLKGSEYTVTNNTNGSVYATTTYIPNLIRIGGFRGSIEFAIAFKEKLTEQEIRSLSNDPYQFLKPKANSPKFLAPPDQGLFLPDSRHEMPELFHPGRKPVGPVEIDWKHPLSDRLRACFLFGSASNTMNLVPEQSNAVLIGSPTFVEGSILLGALDAIKVNLPSFLTTPQGDTWTITLVFRSSGNHHSLARLWEPDIDSTGMVYRGNSDTMLAGAFSAIAGLPNLWDGAYHTLSISVYEIDGTDNLDEHRVSVDGIQYYYSTSSKISAAYTPSDGELYFGNSWALDRPANWYMAALIVHDRYMSKNEHELITHNPYQFLIPR